MNMCYRCRRPAQYRLVATATGGWRRWLRLAPRSWQTCSEHRYDPIGRAHTGRLHHG